MSTENPSSSEATDLKWYQGITRYQWLVLLIASLGWVFDVFEGQIFVASMRDAMPKLVQEAPTEVVTGDDPRVIAWNDRALGSFLLGGAFGGVLFGMLSDRIGRSKTMIITILFYSLFTCVTALAQEPWHMVVLRFFVAMGVGGEWAVASAMVAEVMPSRSRSRMSSIFHASSVFGTLLAAAVGVLIPLIGWRIGFAIGAAPALLTIWIRWKLREPDQWVKAREKAQADSSQQTGRLSDLFSGANLRNTIVGVSLASIGLVTFWGGHIYGKNALLRHAQQEALKADGVPADADKDTKQACFDAHVKEIKRAEMLSMMLNTIGGGLGLVLFGVISERLGRRGAFMMYHAVAFVMMIVMFQVLIKNNASATVLALTLPVFGFFTLGMHAGYAVYFPELYPTRLRGTGAGFCFNMGRLATAAAFFGFGALPKELSPTPEGKALILAPLYLVGVFILFFAKETRGEELPE
ncbi:MAG: MFS transporter [Planctomycetota bacterium]|jgi:MFS family permease